MLFEFAIKNIEIFNQYINCFISTAAKVSILEIDKIY